MRSVGTTSSHTLLVEDDGPGRRSNPSAFEGRGRPLVGRHSPPLLRPRLIPNKPEPRPSRRGATTGTTKSSAGPARRPAQTTLPLRILVQDRVDQRLVAHALFCSLRHEAKEVAFGNRDRDAAVR